MAEFKNKTAIAFADTFFEARKRLPNTILPDLFNFIEKFTNDPTSRGLNYEKLAAMDACLRSVRVNGSYRAIVRIPSEDSMNVYTLLWVDSHDAAYDWASRKKISVNPLTNAVEIFDVIKKEEDTERRHYNCNAPKLFDIISDKELKQINVPAESLFIIRAIQKEDDLEKAKRFLPYDAFESLSFLSSGFSFSEVAKMVAENGILENDEKKNLEQAIIDSKNRERFYVVDSNQGAEEIRQMLENPLDEWRVFLHPLQRRVVENSFSGPTRILGGAGTGKTIVAMHRAKWLAEKVYYRKDDKILFTTYTTNLAGDIATNLKKMCKFDVFSRIEVVNFDKWISDFLLKNRIQEKLIFGDETKKMWEKAVDISGNNLKLPIAFYIDEHEKVVLANEITSCDQYRYINRAGRGIALNREQKLNVWSVMDTYMTLLKNTKTLDVASAALRIKDIINNSCSEVSYKTVIVDEAQDFGAASYKLIRAIAGVEHENDIFIVGDSHQRIYGKKVVLKDCGINIHGRSGRLKINYRTTEEIRRFAQNIIKGLATDDLDDGIDEGIGYISLTHGKEPLVLNFKSTLEENEKIYETIRRWAALNIDSSSICIVARTNRQVDEIRKFLHNKGISSFEIKNTKAEDGSIAGVRIATMHRVKGLEFDCIIIAGVNDGIVPLDNLLDSATDSINKKELFDTERSLLYVAITRAKKEVIITSSGKASKLLYMDN